LLPTFYGGFLVVNRLGLLAFASAIQNGFIITPKPIGLAQFV
jgi:hypothetical protein